MISRPSGHSVYVPISLFIKQKNVKEKTTLTLLSIMDYQMEKNIKKNSHWLSHFQMDAYVCADL